MSQIFNFLLYVPAYTISPLHTNKEQKITPMEIQYIIEDKETTQK
jgi:hypothetical protein